MSLPKYPTVLPSAVAQNGDRADIPQIASHGELSYTSGFPSITQTPLSAGGVPPRRIDFNGIFYELSQHTFYQQSGGMYQWNENLDYPLNALVYGSDNIIYKCIQSNGASDGFEIKDPSLSENHEYWQSIEAPKNPLIYPSAFVSFFEQEPPDGFMVRNGAIIYNATDTVPLLYSALKEAKNAWKSIHENQWQEMHNADLWNGVGGVPFFVLDEVANTIRLPDTRGMYEEGVGFDGLNTVGQVHSDMIRNMYGKIGIYNYSAGGFGTTCDGVFSTIEKAANVGWASPPASGIHSSPYFNASVQVPTGNANKPRAFTVLHCVYTG